MLRARPDIWEAFVLGLAAVRAIRWSTPRACSTPEFGPESRREGAPSKPLLVSSGPAEHALAGTYPTRERRMKKTLGRVGDRASQLDGVAVPLAKLSYLDCLRAALYRAAAAFNVRLGARGFSMASTNASRSRGSRSTMPS